MRCPDGEGVRRAAVGGMGATSGRRTRAVQQHDRSTRNGAHRVRRPWYERQQVRGRARVGERGAPELAKQLQVVLWALRTRPTTRGKRDENTAIRRLSPPSTGSAYRMSADRSPVGGRAFLMLSIFTATTGPSAATGSPVNGESSPAVLGAGEGMPAELAPTTR